MLRSINIWLPDYLRSVLRRPRHVEGTRHLLFCVADHFEPFRRIAGADGNMRVATAEEAKGSVEKWVGMYPAAVGEFRDADGLPPRHTFFYPQEEYDPACVDMLARLCAQGYGEVEVHLHHRNDTAEGLRQKLVAFRDILRTRHGLLGRDRQGNTRYGFVHGNWSLCNSRPDGDWCGVNEELGILRETGCYADFTFPSAPSPTQPRLVNRIYRAVDTPGRPRGCDGGAPLAERGQRSEVRGQRSEIGGRNAEERDERAKERGAPSTEHRPLNAEHSHGLVLITGPLGLDWGRRKWGMLPRVENAGMSAGNPPCTRRVDAWVRQGIHVGGRPEWVFVKAHTHSCVEANRGVMLGEAMRRTREYLHSLYNDGTEWQLHYVTAREMYNIARAAEDGLTGSPGAFRDYEIVSGQLPVVSGGL